MEGVSEDIYLHASSFTGTIDYSILDLYYVAVEDLPASKKSPISGEQLMEWLHANWAKTSWELEKQDQVRDACEVLMLMRLLSPASEDQGSSFAAANLYFWEDAVESSFTAAEAEDMLRGMRSPKTGLSIKDRRYHLKTYKDCFIGSEAVDWMLQERGGLMGSGDREQAVRDLQVLLDRGYIRHVVDDQPFRDGHFFYTFTRKFKGKDITPAKMEQLEHYIKHPERGIALKARPHGKNTIRSSFTGTDVVDWILANTMLVRREEAESVAKNMHERGLFVSAIDDKPFKLESIISKLMAGIECAPYTEGKRTVKQAFRGSDAIAWAISQTGDLFADYQSQEDTTFLFQHLLNRGYLRRLDGKGHFVEHGMYIWKEKRAKTRLSSNSPPGSPRSFGKAALQTLDKRTPNAELLVNKLVLLMMFGSGDVPPMEVKDRRYHARNYSCCFVGSAAVAWMKKHWGMSKDEAIKLGRELDTRDIWHHVCDDHPFKNKQFFYRFKVSELSPILNCAKKCYTGARHPVKLSAQLLIKISQIYYELVDHRGEFSRGLEDPSKSGTLTVSPGAYLNTPGYVSFMLAVAELQQVDLEAQSPLERKVFFLNIYHVLLLHSLFAFPSCETVARCKRHWNNVSYLIGPHRFSLDDIEAGILKGNTLANGSRRIADELKTKYSMPLTDWRILFAISHGTKSSPPIRVYTPSTLDHNLTRVAEHAIGKRVQVDLNNMTLYLPPQVKWHRAVFELEMFGEQPSSSSDTPFSEPKDSKGQAKFARGLLHLIFPFLSALNQEKAGRLLEKTKSTRRNSSEKKEGTISIVYQKEDWRPFLPGLRHSDAQSLRARVKMDRDLKRELGASGSNSSMRGSSPLIRRAHRVRSASIVVATKGAKRQPPGKRSRSIANAVMRSSLHYLPENKTTKHTLILDESMKAKISGCTVKKVCCAPSSACQINVSKLAKSYKYKDKMFLQMNVKEEFEPAGRARSADRRYLAIFYDHNMVKKKQLAASEGMGKGGRRFGGFFLVADTEKDKTQAVALNKTQVECWTFCETLLVSCHKDNSLRVLDCISLVTEQVAIEPGVSLNDSQSAVVPQQLYVENISKGDSESGASDKGDTHYRIYAVTPAWMGVWQWGSTSSSPPGLSFEFEAALSAKSAAPSPGYIRKLLVSKTHVAVDSNIMDDADLCAGVESGKLKTKLMVVGGREVVQVWVLCFFSGHSDAAAPLEGTLVGATRVLTSTASSAGDEVSSFLRFAMEGVTVACGTSAGTVQVYSLHSPDGSEATGSVLGSRSCASLISDESTQEDESVEYISLVSDESDPMVQSPSYMFIDNGKAAITSLTLSGEYMVTGNTEGAIILYNHHTKRKIYRLNIPEEAPDSGAALHESSLAKSARSISSILKCRFTMVDQVQVYDRWVLCVFYSGLIHLYDLFSARSKPEITISPPSVDLSQQQAAIWGVSLDRHLSAGFSCSDPKGSDSRNTSAAGLTHLFAWDLVQVRLRDYLPSVY